MPPKTLHLVRHTQGEHQLPPSHPNETIHDPSLSPDGFSKCSSLRSRFTRHAQVSLLCASALRRTLQTALTAFSPIFSRGLHIIALPDAQEATAAPSDTGSPASVLKKEFAGEPVDFGLLGEEWWIKEGANGIGVRELGERAGRLRSWVWEREEEEVLLVGHGRFLHWVTGDVDERGEQLGEYWENGQWRTYEMMEGESGVRLVETEESRGRRAPG
ncbi:MAG: hypothetical protein MMC23_009297 [Stictis urceolatum]|nr:hypothetical protein [Stictis urceolata]